SEVTNSDQADFLPGSYESVQAQRLTEQAFGTVADATATVVVTRVDGGALTAADQNLVGRVAQEINAARIDRVTSAVTGPQALAPNQRVQLVGVGLQGSPDDPALLDAVQRIRDVTHPIVTGNGLRYGVTGDVAMMLDNQDAFDRALAIVGLATVTLIIVLMLLIYRSPVAALLPIVTISVVSAVATSLIALVAKAFGLETGTDLPILLTIVLFGIGTDYILFLMFRYRERLRAGDQPKQAIAVAVSRVGQVIASAAGVVAVAFLALLAAEFGGFRSFGPSLPIAIGVMLLAALTLVPAIVSLTGPKVFWPSKSWQRTPKATTFRRLGRFVGRRPAVVTLASGGVLVALALGALGTKVDYDQLSQLPTDTESARAFEDLQSGFPAGALNPTSVLVRSDDGRRLDPVALERFATELAALHGVGSVAPAPGAVDGGHVRLSRDGTIAQIDVLLADAPYSNNALHTAGNTLRESAHVQTPPGSSAYIGGLSSAFSDIRAANNRDLSVVFPIAGLLIAVILALLLRSLVAPLYLLLAVGFGFLATLGATVLVFQGIGDAVGLAFGLPIILYLFVVAIGTDYNILMIARLREEARLGKSPAEAADLAVEHAGPSIAAAGLILAGTFASLMLAGLAFLAELGFAVSVGIVIAAFVMSTFLVPGLTAVLGRRAWWPGPVGTPDRSAPVPARQVVPGEAV
ncbi:MAG TPA: MMPL family transporter, partial [Actinomycetes bacterium]|nr:MMPL family transporter [Actinomycetes bacterium]